MNNFDKFKPSDNDSGGTEKVEKSSGIKKWVKKNAVLAGAVGLGYFGSLNNSQAQEQQQSPESSKTKITNVEVGQVVKEQKEKLEAYKNIVKDIQEFEKWKGEVRKEEKYRYALDEAKSINELGEEGYKKMVEKAREASGLASLLKGIDIPDSEEEKIKIEVPVGGFKKRTTEENIAELFELEKWKKEMNKKKSLWEEKICNEFDKLSGIENKGAETFEAQRQLIKHCEDMQRELEILHTVGNIADKDYEEIVKNLNSIKDIVSGKLVHSQSIQSDRIPKIKEAVYRQISTMENK